MLSSPLLPPSGSGAPSQLSFFSSSVDENEYEMQLHKKITAVIIELQEALGKQIFDPHMRIFLEKQKKFEKSNLVPCCWTCSCLLPSKLKSFFPVLFTPVFSSREVFSPVKLKVLRSPPLHFRSRCVLGLDFCESKKQLMFSIWDPHYERKKFVDESSNECQIYHLLILRAMPALIEKFNAMFSKANRSTFLVKSVSFLAAPSSGELLVSLNYDGKNSEKVFIEKQSFDLGKMGVKMLKICHLPMDTISFKNPKSKAINITSEALDKGSKEEVGEKVQPFVTESYDIFGKKVFYKFLGGQFSNPNPEVAKKSVEWLYQKCQEILGGMGRHILQKNKEKSSRQLQALRSSSAYRRAHLSRGQDRGVGVSSSVFEVDASFLEELTPSESLLELYSGMGHHSCLLAPLFKSVVSVELQRGLVRMAEENAQLNGLRNVQFYAQDCEQFCREALEEKLEVPPSRIVLVDPPRSGLSPSVIEFLVGKEGEKRKGRVEHVLYISCSSEALCRDVKTLSEHFFLKEVAIMDHFPYSPHVESGAWLVRKE